MDITGLIFATIQYLQQNWSTVEGLARNLAVDLATLWALGMGLAAIWKKFFPQAEWPGRLVGFLTLGK